MAPTTVADSTKDVETKKASQRKTNKPLIEKRRRARINDCLTQLKTIVLGSSEQQAGRTSKLEKADILEMTVEFVKSRLNKATGSDDPIPLKGDTSIKCDATYVAGYSECLHDISRFLEESLANNTTLKEKLERHVCNKLKLNIFNNLSDAYTTSNNAVCQTSTGHSVSSYSDDMIDLRTNGTHVSNEKSTGERISLNGFLTHTETTDQQLTATGQDRQNSQPIGWLYGEQVVLMMPLNPSIEHTHEPQTFINIIPLTNNSCVSVNSQRIYTFPTQNAMSQSSICSERARDVLTFSTPNAQPLCMNNSELTQYAVVCSKPNAQTECMNSSECTQYVAVCSTPNGQSDSIDTTQRAQGLACSIYAPSCKSLQFRTAPTHNADTIPCWRPW